MAEERLPWKHIHLIGMGGTGLSAIARVLLQQGYRVSGCDRQNGEALQALAALGATVHVGHHPAHVEDVDAVLVSSAVAEGSPEVQAARARGVPVLKRRAFLSAWLAPRAVVAVAGTHGKTTTTGMVVHLWRSAGRRPGYIVGAPVCRWGNADAGEEQAFVIEADEYDYTFWGLEPRVGVITNVEWDHVDCFPAREAYLEAFATFARQVREAVVACADDPGAMDAVAQARVPMVTYGMRPTARWRARVLDVAPGGGVSFQVLRAEQPLGEPVSLAVPGYHNVLNALAALATVEAMGEDPAPLVNNLATYEGAGRRFQRKGTVAGVTVVDDYAHHPTETRATLAAARLAFPGRRLWAVFQPHTYTRTRALLDQWRTAFTDADSVVVMDIYPAREHDTLGLTGEVVAAALEHPCVLFGGDVAATVALLMSQVQPGDVVLTLGAGTSTQVAEGLLTALAEEVAHGMA